MQRNRRSHTVGVRSGRFHSIGSNCSGRRGAIAAIALAALSTKASATLNVYEPFNYSVGTLQGDTNTQTGTTAGVANGGAGTSWLRAGTANPPNQVNVFTGNLDGTPLGLTPSLTGSNSLSLNGGPNNGDGSMNRLAINAGAAGYNSGTVFYSFLLDVTGGLTNSNNTTGAFFFSLNNTANSSQTNNPTTLPGKVQIRVDPTDSSKFNLGVFTNEGATANSAAWATGQLSTNSTYFIVGAYDVTNKVASLWINPDSQFFGSGTAPTATAQDTNAGTTFSSGIQSILVRQNALLPNLLMDEVRVGNSWATVTPANLPDVTNGLWWDIDGATTAGAGGTSPSGTWDNVINNFTTDKYGGSAGTTWTAGKVAVFSAGSDATGSYTITVSGTQSASGLVFEDGTATLTGGEVDLTGAATANVALGHTATIDSVVGGSNGLNKNSLGTLALGGTNTYTGGTTINAGAVHFKILAAMPVSGTVTANSGGTLSVRAGGTGEWAIDPTNAAGTLGGLIAGTGGQGNPVNFTDGSNLQISTLNANASTTYSGTIGSFHTASGTTDNVGLIKTGTGTTLYLTGNNTFSGPLTIASDGGVLALVGTNNNAGQNMAIPTVTIGTTTGSAGVTDGSLDVGIKILQNNALPTNSLISMGSSTTGADAPSALLQLYDANASTGNLPTTFSFNQTIRGVIGGNGRIKVGVGTLTINVPANESYTSNAVLRADYNTATDHGAVIKTGAGRQDLTDDSSGFNGDFILQQGTLGIGANNFAGPAANLNNVLIIQGGTMTNIGTVNLGVTRIHVDGDFAVLQGGGSDFQLNGNGGNTTTTLDVSNATINVIAGSGGQFIIPGPIVDDPNSAPRGITKTGGGTLTLGSNSSTYRGETTIQQGILRLRGQNNANAIGYGRIGDGTGRVNLSGGTLEYNGSIAITGDPRSITVSNPLRVTADSMIAFSTSSTLSGDIDFNFTSNTIDSTGGTLTLRHNSPSSGPGAIFKPTFSGSGFNMASPVVVDNGSNGSTVFQSTNSTGTQTWSGGISGNGSLTHNGAGNMQVKNLTLTGAVTVSGGGTLRIGDVTAGGQNTANTSILSSVPVIDATSQMDLGDHTLIVNYPASDTTHSTREAIRNLLVNGRNAPPANAAPWNGNGGITSTYAHNVGNGFNLAIGYADNTDLAAVRASGSYTTFGGQTVASNTVLVQLTRGADATLDGVVDGQDVAIIGTHFQKPGSGQWCFGDFDYSGTCDGSDVSVLGTTFGKTSPILSPAQMTAEFGSAFTAAFEAGQSGAVPEPASLTLIGLAGFALVNRRRRARNRGA